VKIELDKIYLHLVSVLTLIVMLYMVIVCNVMGIEVFKERWVLTPIAGIMASIGSYYIMSGKEKKIKTLGKILLLSGGIMLIVVALL